MGTKGNGRHARLEMEESTGGNWRFRLRARNGRIVGPTEGYKGGPAKLRRGIEAMARALDEARKHPVVVVPRHGRTIPMPWGKSRPRT